ncbi:hypothetical protein BBP40_010036 [Aspergillus hancockii]|nr:hypothetical protein BBP40_010036 [Aspergillus hancockii]
MATVTKHNTYVAKATLSTFASIPVLDLDLARSYATKPKFLAQLRDALVIVGFFYIKNSAIPQEVQDAFIQKSMELCNLPLEKKMEIDMINSKHFLGYSRMGLERTARQIDRREMFDFLTPMPPPAPGDPIWMNVQGPNQWPDENVVPGFRRALESYLAAISDLGNIMKALVAEALDLNPKALDGFFHDPPRNKVSLLKYPPPPIAPDSTETKFQGVGAHKDGGFLTYLLQATPHSGLEVQNKSGQWVSVPPIEGTFVINVGRSLEAMTGGGHSLGPRFSYPVFQTLRLDLMHDELCSLQLPAHIRKLVQDQSVKSDAEAFFSQYHLRSPGQGIFTARLTSHPDVGRRWYPELLEEALKAQKEFQKLDH